MFNFESNWAEWSANAPAITRTLRQAAQLSRGCTETSSFRCTYSEISIVLQAHESVICTLFTQFLVFRNLRCGVILKARRWKIVTGCILWGDRGWDRREISQRYHSAPDQILEDRQFYDREDLDLATLEVVIIMTKACPCPDIALEGKTRDEIGRTEVLYRERSPSTNLTMSSRQQVGRIAPRSYSDKRGGGDLYRERSPSTTTNLTLSSK